MSRNLDAVAVTLFDTEVKQAYQGMQTLRMCVRQRNNVTGDTYKFRLMGKGIASERGAPSSDVVPMNITHSLPTATLTNWDASEYTDIYDQAAVNFQEVQELATTIAGALGRRDDQLIIDQLANANYAAADVKPVAGEAGFVSTNIGGAATGLNVAKLRAAAKYLNQREIPSSDRYVLVNEEALDQLLAETEVTSTDFNSVKALVKGEVNTFLGFEFKRIGEREEGGLPLSGGLRTLYVWHKNSAGHAVGLDFQTRVDWSVDKKSWLSTGSLKAGSAVIDSEGIVKIQITE